MAVKVTDTGSPSSLPESLLSPSAGPEWISLS